MNESDKMHVILFIFEMRIIHEPPVGETGANRTLFAHPNRLTLSVQSVEAMYVEFRRRNAADVEKAEGISYPNCHEYHKHFRRSHAR